MDHVSATSHPSATRAVALAMLVLSGLQLMVVLDGTVANLALAPLQSDLDCRMRVATGSSPRTLSLSAG
ncbi:hypothetical protein NJ76_13690 [Rhodococcus sp. IITR03]|nr:hypothetical protein NJ76_13690 [Rhodococcus sp. IITR03]